MENNICLHGIYAKSDYYNEIKTLCILEEILKSRALLSRRLQNNMQDNYYNGFDYISLCDYSKRKEHFLGLANAYESYICYSLAIMFPKEKLSIVVPEMINIISNGNYDNYYANMKKLGLNSKKRYSDMADEVQVKDFISLDLMTGITLPIDKMLTSARNENINIKRLLKIIDIILVTLDKYNYNVPIYDIGTFTRIDNELDLKYLVKHK